MRCEHCPAMIQCGGTYEYPEYSCVVQDESNIRTFADGEDGCGLHMKTIQKRLAQYRDNLASEKLAIEADHNGRYVKQYAGAMRKALNDDGVSLTRSAEDYPIWQELNGAGFAECTPADITPPWEEEQYSTEVLRYTVTQEGIKWLQRRKMHE